MVNKLTEKDFHQVEEKNLAIIDFNANWCGPCKMLAPVLEEVSEEFAGKAEFYSVDVDQNMGLAQKFGITNIPALVVLKKGEKVDFQVGFQPKPNLTAFVEQYV